MKECIIPFEKNGDSLKIPLPIEKLLLISILIAILVVYNSNIIGPLCNNFC